MRSRQDRKAGTAHGGRIVHHARNLGPRAMAQGESDGQTPDETNQSGHEGGGFGKGWTLERERSPGRDPIPAIENDKAPPPRQFLRRTTLPTVFKHRPPMRRVGTSPSKAPTHTLQISFNSRSKSQELGSGTDRIGLGHWLFLRFIWSLWIGTFPSPDRSPPS